MKQVRAAVGNEGPVVAVKDPNMARRGMSGKEIPLKVAMSDSQKWRWK